MWFTLHRVNALLNCWLGEWRKVKWRKCLLPERKNILGWPTQQQQQTWQSQWSGCLITWQYWNMKFTVGFHTAHITASAEHWWMHVRCQHLQPLLQKHFTCHSNLKSLRTLHQDDWERYIKEDGQWPYRTPKCWLLQKREELKEDVVTQTVMVTCVHHTSFMQDFWSLACRWKVLWVSNRGENV